VLLFKLLFTACHVVGALLARGLAERVQSGSGARVFLLVLWHPLLLLELCGSAHNDAVPMLLTLLAVSALLRARETLSVLALGGAALAKFTPALLGPLGLAWLLRARRWRGALIGTLLVVGLVILWWLRFYRPTGALDFLAKQSAMVRASPVWVLSEQWGLATTDIVLTAGRVLVVVMAFWWAFRLWQEPQPRRLLVAAAALLLLVSTVAVTLFCPWYHTWWIGLALAAGGGYLHRAAGWLMVTGPMSYVVYAGLRRFDAPHEWCQVLLALGLPLVLAAHPRWVHGQK
jgi:hypothetical protein